MRKTWLIKTEYITCDHVLTDADTLEEALKNYNQKFLETCELKQAYQGKVQVVSITVYDPENYKEE